MKINQLGMMPLFQLTNSKYHQYLRIIKTMPTLRHKDPCFLFMIDYLVFYSRESHNSKKQRKIIRKFQV